MIYKHPDYKNGYVFAPSSCDKDFQDILEEYRKTPKGLRCVICNENTLRNFIVWSPVLVINKKLVDGVFFINGVF